MINPKIAVAVLAGYLLGRTKKAKLAMSLGAMLAGSRVRPDQLGKLLQDSPLVGNISEQVRTELADAGKSAATTLLSAKAESLADALHDRTTGLKERAYGGDEDGENGENGEEDEGERGEDRGEGRRTGARKSQASRSAARQKKTQARAPGQGSEARKKKAPAKKAPAKKAPAAQSRAKSGSARSRRPDDG
ncbi:ABC transporter substrate-binding protein [Streptomyces sp. NPDC052036]|uniref:ABC transporter substrate-binding protein n=1 Tax=Streptomyces sp. NPDC052036 TaxID=3155171 RepID=UPI00342D1D9D